jgi:glycosyltransferase involved in cell wall biosynthesis
MIELQKWRPRFGSDVRIGVVSTYPPTRCGIARFTDSLIRSVADNDALGFDVVRLVSEHAIDGDCNYPVTMEFDPSSHVGVKAAAAHLNRRDAAIINHEFGIFGVDDGEAVLDLANLLDVPTVTILHTVLPEPTDRQRRIIEQLAENTTPVVLCDAALEILTSSYDVSPSGVEVIYHGASWDPQPVNHSPRRRLITWGLLGPGKNLEQAIAAIAELDELDPPLHYQIVGRLHPAFVRHHGNAYRSELSRLVFDLGLEDRVEFVDRYVEDAELLNMVRQADLVVVPYGNSDQVSSGVITEAIGAGRPVVSTRFPYAEEMVGSGPGIVVDHDPASLAAGIHRLLDDTVAYRRAARAASQLSADLSWSSVGRQYARLIRQLVPSRVTA